MIFWNSKLRFSPQSCASQRLFRAMQPSCMWNHNFSKNIQRYVLAPMETVHDFLNLKSIVFEYFETWVLQILVHIAHIINATFWGYSLDLYIEHLDRMDEQHLYWEFIEEVLICMYKIITSLNFTLILYSFNTIGVGTFLYEFRQTYKILT
jgi:hypothetical protein